MTIILTLYHVSLQFPIRLCKSGARLDHPPLTPPLMGGELISSPWVGEDYGEGERGAGRATWAQADRTQAGLKDGGPCTEDG